MIINNEFVIEQKDLFKADDATEWILSETYFNRKVQQYLDKYVGCGTDIRDSEDKFVLASPNSTEIKSNCVRYFKNFPAGAHHIM